MIKISAAVAGILGVASACWVTGAQASHSGIADLSLEELLSVQVYSASRFQQKTTEAPAAVTIVTAADIRDHGYRTLADILSGVRGLHISNDRSYTYLGVRGFGRTGDYNGRILLLVDGHRFNDPIYDTAAIGTEFPIDVDLIERVEVVRGPGSSVYGSNAFFGIVNVITRRGGEMAGVHLAGEVASFNTQRQRASWAGRNEDGMEWLLSTTRYRSEGQDHDYPEFGGTARDLDSDRFDQLFARLTQGQWTLATSWGTRNKKVPTAAWDTEFNDPNHEDADTHAHVALTYDGSAQGHWEPMARLFLGHYAYDGRFPYIYEDGDPVTVNRDRVRARWWGTELRLLGRFDRHTVVVGAEYQDNRQQDQANFDTATHEVYFDDRRSSTRSGLYVQDEIALAQHWLLNAGVRYDHYSTIGGALNPRLALIWQPRATTAIKWLYGTAYRAPNAYELYYTVEPNKANPDLRAERINSHEWVVEHTVAHDWRLSVSAYHNRITDLIEHIVDPDDGMLVFENIGEAEAYGAELEVERHWRHGTRLRASYAWQHTENKDSGERLVNSPRHLLKMNLAAPVLDTGWRGGIELQYTGERQTLQSDKAKAYWLTNLTLTRDALIRGLDLSLSAYNLFDQAYTYPGGPEHIHESGAILDQIPADGRHYRLKLHYRF